MVNDASDPNHRRCDGLQCLTYLSVSGVLAGVDADLSFYLLSIANACSLFGRIGGGALADRVGESSTLEPRPLNSIPY